MANLFSTKALQADESYLEFSTLDGALDYSFEDNSDIEFQGSTYQDGLFITTQVNGSYYVWGFGGTGFRFDGDGNVLAGTVTGIVIFGYDPDLDELTGVHLAVSGFKSSLREIVDAATPSTSDDEAFWNKVLGKADVIDLSDEDDEMVGLAGNDTIDGNGGDDILIGGLGNDILTGGAGKDVFVFESAFGKKNLDSVTDFNAEDDYLAFEISVFSALEERNLAEDEFVVGSKALDANDFLVYNNGTLFYDADGSGKGKAIAVVTLTGVPNLTYANISAYLDE